MRKVLAGFAVGAALVVGSSPSSAVAVETWSDRLVYVNDEFAYTTTGVREWRNARNRVLWAYGAAGFRFVVTEKEPGPCIIDRHSTLPPQTILVCRGGGSFLWGWNGDGVGIATVLNDQRILCHEFGHALGLQHRLDRTGFRTSCMTVWMRWGASGKPDAYDIATLREEVTA